MSDESNLPPGWALATIGEVTQASKKKVAPVDAGDVAYIGLEHIESNSGRILEKGRAADVKSTKSAFSAGDVLYGKLRPYLNKVCIPDFSGICSTDILVFPKKEGLENRLLRHLLSTKGYLEFARLNSKGINLPRISFSKMAEYEFGLPPVNEQRRVVAKIEVLQERSQSARTALDAIPPLLEKFRQSVLAVAFRGDLTAEWRAQNPDVETADSALEKSAEQVEETRHLKKLLRRKSDGIGAFKSNSKQPGTWAVANVRELVRSGAILDFQDGNHGSLYPRKAEFGSKGMKFLTATQIGLGEVDIDAAPRLKLKKAKQLKIGFTQPNDVLLTHNATVGRVALMPDVGEQVVLGTSVTYYRTHSAQLLPKFLYYQFLADIWQQQLRDVMKQTTRNQVSVNKQIEFSLFIPPVKEQQEIVRKIDERFALTSAIANSIDVCRSKAEALDPVILAKAFRGELVSQDPNDEPAAVLLERLRAPGKVVDSKRKSQAKRGSKKMAKLTTDSIKQVIAEFPSDKFSFDDLRQEIGGDYDSLRNLVFELLAEKKPSIKQVFDSKEDRIVFVRSML